MNEPKEITIKVENLNEPEINETITKIKVEYNNTIYYGKKIVSESSDTPFIKTKYIWDSKADVKNPYKKDKLNSKDKEFLKSIENEITNHSYLANGTYTFKHPLSKAALS